VRELSVVVVGAGEVGTTIVEALHVDHSVTVIDSDPERVRAVGGRYDVLGIHGDGSSRRVLDEAGVRQADLVITCTTRDEVNIVAALAARRQSEARTIVRVANAEYLEVWRTGEFTFDLMVCPPLETAHAIVRHTGVPAARQTDMFAGGLVQMVEFDIPRNHPVDELVGRRLAEATVPAESKVAAIIRGGTVVVPRGPDIIQPGDRVVVIASPSSARVWSELVEGNPAIGSVVVIGTRKSGAAAAAELAERDIKVRLIEPDGPRARQMAEALPGVRVAHGDPTDPEFLASEHIAHADAVVCALGDDPSNLVAAAHARMLGVPLIIAVINRPKSAGVFEHVGVDVAINPQAVTAEEILRFTRDPRTRAVAILEQGGAEVLEIEVRPQSRLIGVPFRELPVDGSVIGAIVRDGRAIFPHGEDVLLPGDRAVVFTRAGRADAIERAL
jgi:trk system potassium uptake protein TrkA